MKRKFALIAFALACVIACSFGFVACNGGDDGEKTLTGIVIVDANSAEYSGSYSLGTITKGEQPDLSYNVCAKYSDGTTESINSQDLTVTYSYNGTGIASLPAAYEVGEYLITYSYQTYTVSVTFAVSHSANARYAISVDKTTWKYLEEPAISVTVDGTAAVNYSVYCITETDYNQIKDEADFEQQLLDKSNSYIGEYTAPDTYYLYARVDTECTNFVKVTIQKADLTLAEESVTVSVDTFVYGQNGRYGNVKISDAFTYLGGPAQCFVNSLDIAVSGYWAWVNPDEEINSTHNGQTRDVKFITDDGCYNDYVIEDAATLVIQRCRIYAPTLKASGFNTYSTYYDGTEKEIFLDVNSFNEPYITVTRDGEPVTIGENGLIGKETDTGDYVYTVVLLDKVNFFWNGDEYSDTSDVADKQLTFTISKLPSWVNIFHQEGADDHSYTYMIDENLQVRIKLIPGIDVNSDSYNSSISPYVAGSLEVEVLQDYYSTTTQIEATAAIENDGEYDWLVITVSDFKDRNNGDLILHFTGTGASYYQDIDKVIDILSISKYVGTITCPLADILENNTMEQPAGITVAELYETYPQLTTALGKWRLEYDYNNSGDWKPLGDSMALPRTSLSCRLVFESGFVADADRIAAYEFTLIGQ